MFNSNSGEKVTDRNAQIITKSGTVKTRNLTLRVAIRNGCTGANPGHSKGTTVTLGQWLTAINRIVGCCPLEKGNGIWLS